MGVDLQNIQNWFTVNPKINGQEVAPVKRVNYQSQQEQGIAAINREVAPKCLDTEATGSYYTNGRGHFNYGMGFAPYKA